MNCGIYEIINIKNNKIYIGSSNSLKKRKSLHFNSLRNNSHHCSHLQKSFIKYGEDNFKFRVIKDLVKIEDLVYLEQLYLNKYIIDGIIDHTRCYNISPTAGNNSGIIRSEEFKEKDRKSHIGKKHKEESKTKVSIGNKGKKRSKESKIKYSLINKDKKLSKETKNRIGLKSLNRGNKKVINIDTGAIYISIKEASEKCSIDSSSIGKVCNGNRNKAGGYKWQFIK